MNWPRKVFLESTALFQLGSKLQKPEFAKLKERQQYLNFELFVSEVSWAEYIRQRAAFSHSDWKCVEPATPISVATIRPWNHNWDFLPLPLPARSNQTLYAGTQARPHRNPRLEVGRPAINHGRYARCDGRRWTQGYSL